MFERGEIVLIPYPFTDLSSKKQRPVLTLSAPDQQGDFIALPITSRGYHKNSISLENYLQEGKLPKPSWVRTDRIVTLNQISVIKRFAVCTEVLLEKSVQKLCAYIDITSSNATEPHW